MGHKIISTDRSPMPTCVMLFTRPGCNANASAFCASSSFIQLSTSLTYWTADSGTNQSSQMMHLLEHCQLHSQCKMSTDDADLGNCLEVDCMQ